MYWEPREKEMEYRGRNKKLIFFGLNALDIKA
jgi:hypothetical protein